MLDECWQGVDRIEPQIEFGVGSIAWVKVRMRKPTFKYKLMKARTYGCSDVAMIIAARVIAKNLLNQLAELTAIRTTWTQVFIDALMAKIDSLATDVLGKSSKTALFEATANLTDLITPARKDISALKIQIDIDYKKDPVKHKLILDELGYTANLKKIQNKNQKSVIMFLTLFSRNVSKYQTEMMANGTPKALLDRIAGYGEVITLANTIQEELKSSGKLLTAENIAKLESLYEEVGSICKIAANHFIGNKIKKEMFTFNKVVANLGMEIEAEKTQKAVV